MFNEVLQYASGDKDYKFNPSAFVCNEAGTNFCGIKEVYGEEFVKTRVFGCQWYFQNDMHRKAQSIGDAGIRVKFVNICKKILQATTVSKYNVLKSMLDEITKLCPHIKPWIAWWHARCTHIFPAFQMEGLPKVNFREIGNAGWKSNGGTLCLASAAMQDISTMMCQEKELEKFNSQCGRSSSRGPTRSVQDARDGCAQIKMAQEFVNILHDPEAIMEQVQQATNPASFLPGKGLKHWPSTKK